jgi:hypothetical protein
MTTPTHSTDDVKDIKLTRTEMAHVKELEHLAKKLKEANLLYGSALDGMQPVIDDAAKKLDEYGLDERMSRVEEELATQAAGMLEEGVVNGVGEIEADLGQDDVEEEEELSQDEAEPEEASQ